MYGTQWLVSIPMAIILLGTGLYMIFNTRKEDKIEGVGKK